MALGAIWLSFIEGESLLKHRVRERTKITNQWHSVRTACALADSFQGWLSTIRIKMINLMQMGQNGDRQLLALLYPGLQISSTLSSAPWSLFNPLTATFSRLSFLILLRHSTLGTDRAAWLRNDAERFIVIDSSLESEAWKGKLRCGTFFF